VWGSFHCAKAAHPHLRQAGDRGRFIIVTSRAGLEPSLERPVYAAVKAAQIGLIGGLAREWGGQGITVNGIAPVAMTPALEAAFAASPAMAARVRARSALGRIGDPERDIGPLAVFLASDGASYITGQTILCDGGSI
jgi:NAD(P)-dependent dehydrogenase (short-subunit alcohol dehydrogenase family)